jgi:hypothetical protein
MTLKWLLFNNLVLKHSNINDFSIVSPILIFFIKISIEIKTIQHSSAGRRGTNFQHHSHCVPRPSKEPRGSKQARSTVSHGSFPRVVLSRLTLARVACTAPICAGSSNFHTVIGKHHLQKSPLSQRQRRRHQGDCSLAVEGS